MVARRTRASVVRGFTPNGIVTLTTDFGTRDAYVGAVKGVLLSAERGLSLHDLAHDVPPQDVAHGARLLRGACPFFPAGTVHLGVVDPGVGSERAAIVVLAGGHAFVGPDNGLFSPVAAALGGVDGCWAIAPRALGARLPATPAPTFHGRDLFAPVAAALASGAIAPTDVGAAHRPIALPAPPPPRRDRAGSLVGRVTHFDRFGNAVTNLAAAEAKRYRPRGIVSLASGEELRVGTTYAEVEPGAALALVGSDGWLEIAVRDGSARERLRLTVGARVEMRREGA
jgi:S-adenosyl-L-methionine hydrolase (adenosine-forming)